MFDKARSAVQEALDLYSCCYGMESESLVICHDIFGDQAIAISKKLGSPSRLSGSR